MRNTSIQRQMLRRPARRDKSQEQVAVEKAVQRSQFDHITDVNGRRILEKNTFVCIRFGNEFKISIPTLNFNGSAEELLRLHGLIYNDGGENTLKTENYLRSLMPEPISYLELSVRASNNLEAAGIKTIGDLVSNMESVLLKCMSISRTTLNEVKESLTGLGLALDGDIVS